MPCACGLTMNRSVVMTTADGVPLKVSLARARRRNRNRALLLVAPLFAFIVVTFFIPIVSMLFAASRTTSSPQPCRAPCRCSRSG